MLSKILARIRETGIINVELLIEELNLSKETIRGMLKHLADLGYLEVIRLKETACTQPTPTSPLCFGCTGCSPQTSPTDDNILAYRLREAGN